MVFLSRTWIIFWATFQKNCYLKQEALKNLNRSSELISNIHFFLSRRPCFFFLDKKNWRQPQTPSDDNSSDGPWARWDKNNHNTIYIYYTATCTTSWLNIARCKQYLCGFHMIIYCKPYDYHDHVFQFWLCTHQLFFYKLRILVNITTGHEFCS